MKLVFVSALLIFTSWQAQASCGAGDSTLSSTVETSVQSCTGAGYCYAGDVNPETGSFEYFYGFHANCEGRQEKQNNKYQCQREDSSVYESVDEGVWGFCNI